MIRFYWRFIRVTFHFFPLALEYLRDRRRFFIIGDSRDVTPEMRKRRAKRLLDSFITLGPTFIKLGQILSTRPDVLPREYIDTLSELQDTVPPAPYKDAKKVVEEELGGIDEVFDTFEPDAISGASLGQVHIAEYKGEKVAVKVRRPGVKELVEVDLRIIKLFLPIVTHFINEGQAYSLRNLADEFDRVIHEEMDYHREARMLKEIKKNFREDRNVVIPGTYDDVSTRRVLTLEYVGGIKITDVDAIRRQGHDPSRIARNLEKAYLRMILDDGVFHGDPHPGNLAVNERGQIVFYDFGMSGRVPPRMRTKIVNFYISVANRDAEGIMDALIDMGTLDPSVNKNTMIRVLEIVIEDLQGEEIEEWRVQQIINEVENTIYEYPFRLPPNMALVLRVATVLEGVCLQLDPDINFIDVAAEYLLEEDYLEEGVEKFIEDTRKQAEDTVKAAVRTPVKLEKVLDKIERNDLQVRAELRDTRSYIDRLGKRLAYSILAGTLVISASILATINILYGVPPLLGSFFFFVLLIISLRRGRGLRGEPQFTRHEMRKRRE